MNLQEANQKANYMTDLTRISYSVIKTNKEYNIVQTENWTGKIEKTYCYENTKENKSTTDKAVSELLNTSGKEVLPGNRVKRSKASAKNK